MSNDSIKISDMVLVPQNVYVSSVGLNKITLNNEPFYAVVLEINPHFMDGGSRIGNLIIDHNGTKVIVDQEDVYKC